MYVWWPFCPFTDEETKLVVIVEITHKHAHEHVLAGNIIPCSTVRLGNLLIERLAQFGRDNFIGIDHEDPFARSRLNGKRTRRLSTLMIRLRKSHDTTTIAGSNLTGVVGALHVAHHDLVKLLHRLQHLFKMLMGVIGIDNYRYFLRFVHIFLINVAIRLQS